MYMCADPLLLVKIRNQLKRYTQTFEKKAASVSQQGDDGPSGSPGKTGRVGRRVRAFSLFESTEFAKIETFPHSF